MGKESKKEQNNKENPILTNVLLEQLDKWISDCQLQADVFFEGEAQVSGISSLAMKVAYQNVANFVMTTKPTLHLFENYSSDNIILELAMSALDDYLNAGTKEARAEASKKAKLVYKNYYGVDYINRNER